MHPHHALGPCRRRGDLGHRQRRRVRGEDRIGTADPVQIREESELRLELFDDRLDHEVAVCERLELGDRRETTHGGVALVPGYQALVDLAAEELRDARGSSGAELGRDLPSDRLVARLDRELGDPRAHRTEADHADR